MKKLRIEKSKYPTKEEPYVLWLESESKNIEKGGYGFKCILKGTYQECLSEKERLEVNVHKPKKYSFSLLREALHDRRQKSRVLVRYTRLTTCDIRA